MSDHALIRDVFNKQLVQTPQLVLQNVGTYLNQFRMVNDQVDFGFILSDNLS